MDGGAVEAEIVAPFAVHVERDGNGPPDPHPRPAGDPIVCGRRATDRVLELHTRWAVKTVRCPHSGSVPDRSAPSTHAESSAVRDLPPRAKLGAKILEYEGAGTQAELVESTLLPARTVRYALTQRGENGLVTSRTRLWMPDSESIRSKRIRCKLPQRVS